MILRDQLNSQAIILCDRFYNHVNFFTKQLLTWNKIHNMTGAKSKKEIEMHLFDAVYPIKFLDSFRTCLDIGTGAGFPGLIMAMALEKTHFTLVEPLRKRSSFLTFISATLKMKNITVINKKIQDISLRPFELITSRAVASTENLIKLSKPFIQKGTLLLYFKGEQVFKEIKEKYEYKIIQAPHRNYLIIQR